MPPISVRRRRVAGVRSCPPSLSRTSAVGLIVAVAAVIVGTLAGPPATGQEVEAAVGAPFGVAKLTLPVIGSDIEPTREAYGFTVRDATMRIRYPVFTAPPLGRLFGRIFGGGQGGPLRTNVYFLFTGTEPFDAVVSTPGVQVVRVTPTADPRQFERLRREWLEAYVREASGRVAAGDYPPDLEAYLTAMLTRRIGGRAVLPIPPPTSEPSELVRTIELLFGSDRLRLELIDEAFRRTGPPEPAMLPPPDPLPWRPSYVPPLPEGIVTEPIADVVPHDCFYVRFGSFTNYLWLDRLMKEYAGEIARLATLRGQALPTSNDPADQLALEQDALAEIFGPRVIADIAVVGYDLFLQEGAAVGVIFQAKSGLLGTTFAGQRRKTLRDWKDRGATLEDVEIAGQSVSFLSTPDHRLRSFYAVRGDYHLHTNTRALVEAFLTVGTETPSLAVPLSSTPEFRHARLRMPLTREDTIFTYLSTGFLQRLVDQPAQIELRRRTTSAMEIRVLEMARLAAAAEGIDAATVPELIAAGLLPPGFGVRADGSALVELPSGELGDTIRGFPGSFVPIPDMPPTAVTAAEAAGAATRERYVRELWPEMDPLLAGIKRYALGETGTLERVVIDADVSPLEEEKWAILLSLLAPPTTRQVPPVPGELIHAEAAVRGGLIFPDVPEHTLTLGILDAPTATPIDVQGILGTLATVRATPGYLAAWPAPGFLDRLTFGLVPPPDPYGYTSLMFGLTRWQGNGFSILSFQRGVLDLAAATLRPSIAARPAQIRVAIGDLAGSNLAGWIETLYRERARQTSAGNVRMMHLVSEQFRIARPDARAAAQRIVDAELIDPLGGDYRVTPVEGGVVQWRSQGVVEGEPLPPPTVTIDPLPPGESPIEKLRPGAPPLPPPLDGDPAAAPPVTPPAGTPPAIAPPEALPPAAGERVAPPPVPVPAVTPPPPPGPITVPATVPLLAWFRGLSFELTYVKGQIVVHAEITLTRAPREPVRAPAAADLLPSGLPSWGDFVPRSIPGLSFGGSSDDDDDVSDE